MKYVGLAVLAATILFAPVSNSHAQVGEAHFRAWDAHSGGSKARARTTTRRSAARARRGIPARYSPSIAREPIARAINQVIGSRPSGCPRAYCGCAVALQVFGKHVPNLWLAANWLKYPAASPAPGMVAARRGHVMLIKQYLGGNKALVYDPNSGRGLTRTHVRSLAGFSVRNPRA